MSKRILFVSILMIFLSVNAELIVMKDVSAETSPIPTTEKPIISSPKPSELAISEGSSLPPSSSLSHEISSEIEKEIENSKPTTNRRKIKISYDQRQEGQYNIRADLDNFMIVVIPPNPVAGVNLLDILTRSASQKRSQNKKLPKKHQTIEDIGKLFTGSDIQKINDEQQRSQQEINYHNDQLQQQQLLIDGPAARLNEFIEGRTPYRVDISSSGEPDFVNTNIGHHIQTDSQVDVLPPPYPHLHLMKPYHLEAEPVIPQSPSILSSLASSLMPSQGLQQQQQNKFMEFVRGFTGGNSVRIGKALRDYPLNFKELNSNRVLLNGNLDVRTFKRNIDDDELPPPSPFDMKTFVDLSDTIDPLENTNFGNYDAYNTRAIESIHGDGNTGNGNWELKLLGASEQCGPDRRRDSYGICQFVPADLI